MSVRRTTACVLEQVRVAVQQRRRNGKLPLAKEPLFEREIEAEERGAGRRDHKGVKTCG